MNWIPNIYPTGGPLYWRGEQSGKLAEAIDVYFRHRCEPTKPAMTPEQIKLLRDYLVHWINAPCWTREVDPRLFLKLIDSAPGLSTEDEIARWLSLALDVGVDPL